MTSKNQLRRISKRIRDGQVEGSANATIQSFVLDKVPSLISLSGTMERRVASEVERWVLAGRAKRVKSIIRKVARTPGSNIATLADLVGLRIVVRDLNEANSVITVLKESFTIRNVKDYTQSKDTGYRAIHLYVDWNDVVVEVQVRTLPQQLWAIESEAFGERVKEGSGSSIIRQYLAQLSELCWQIDNGSSLSDLREVEGALGSQRGPIIGRYPLLQQEFNEIEAGIGEDKLFVVVFDNKVSELLTDDSFRPNQVEEATEHYRYKSRMLDNDRYDVVLITSISQPVMRISHANFFPSRAGL